MYFDEDGDLAHEFYCEVTDRETNKVVMRQCLNNLIPEVYLFSNLQKFYDIDLFSFSFRSFKKRFLRGHL